jgi:phosphoribosylformylglycinamidine cyclo-ligase
MKTSHTYAGVPHLKGDARFNRSLAQVVKSTQTDSSNGFGGFSALIDFKKYKFRDPLLVTATDGVGTKLELARYQNKHDSIGVDLIAMSVNDLITCGAKPILFLDYFAAGAFNKERILEVLRGIARGCREAGCSLVGGETAIMPGFYGRTQYDLAGFSVGLVERKSVIRGSGVQSGDVILGLASSGFHSNGYSLLRKVFTKRELSGRIGHKLLTPTRIYVKACLDVIRKVRVNAIANITGGGFYDNIPRVLSQSLGARIIQKSWRQDPLFGEVKKRSKYSTEQMFRTFNMGIGMVFILKKSVVTQVQKILLKHQVHSWPIGHITKETGVQIV